MTASTVLSVARISLVLAMIFLRFIHAKPLVHHYTFCFVRNTPQRRHHRALFSSSSSSVYTLQLMIPTAEDMQDLGAVLSMDTGPGDVLLLGGDLGAGKTVFSRGFVRARTGDWTQTVTSPTYLLSNTYPAKDVLIHHMDLYRLSDEQDLESLDMDNVLTNCIALIEWPSRLGSKIPETRLDVSFRIQDNETTTWNDNEMQDVEDIPRLVTLEAHGAKWTKRLQLLVDEGYVDDLLV